MMKVVCGWCGLTMTEGDEPISHGMCPACATRVEANEAQLRGTPDLSDPIIAEIERQMDTPSAPKPEKRSTTVRRHRRATAERTAAVRAFVFGRERGICRCCRRRPADSMHELRPRSLGGLISHKNSVAVCGSGTTGCHGMLQARRITYTHGGDLAQGVLWFIPKDQPAAEWMRIALGQTIESAPMRDLDAE